MDYSTVTPNRGIKTILIKRYACKNNNYNFLNNVKLASIEILHRELKF